MNHQILRLIIMIKQLILQESVSEKILEIMKNLIKFGMNGQIILFYVHRLIKTKLFSFKIVVLIPNQRELSSIFVDVIQKFEMIAKMIQK